MAGTLSEPRQRAPLFHKQKTAALRVMAAFFERLSTNRRPLLAGAKYKRNRPGMIEIFYVNQVGDFYARSTVFAASRDRIGWEIPRQIGNNCGGIKERNGTEIDELLEK